LQILQYNGIDLYRFIKPILPGGYYQGLTLHGVLNVLVFTTFYIIGFLTLITAKAFDKPLVHKGLGWFTFWLMLGGLLMTALPILLNNATVLFTFYPPLKADGFFYLGLTLIVVGTYFLLLNQALTYRVWRKENPKAKIPLPAFMAIVTMSMWVIATIGIASEMLFLLIPWSFGWVEGTDVLLARTLFWFTGHPIVYFWLLPAYISWYTMIPKQAGGKLFSEPMARVSFVLFLVLSIPIGIHHQYTDPGISEIWKLVHFIFTVGVFFPSLLTFFNVVASLEHAGRSRGGKGWLAWIFALPWKSATFTAQVFAMILFAFGGAGGVINASYNLNLVVHNTAWISGHFHLTVGSAVALSFMGMGYWLVPYLSGRRLFSNFLGLAASWCWLIGMILFSHFMHMLGLLGVPRRSMLGGAPYFNESTYAGVAEWRLLLPIAMVGGLVMFVSAILFYANMVLTITRGQPEPNQQIPFAEKISGPEDVPTVLDRFWPWVVGAILLIAINYGPTLYYLISTSRLNIPGMRPW
jgi:cytochrome c oxidase subunit 1